MVLAGFTLIAFVSALAYSLTDVTKLALKKVPGFDKVKEVLLPLLTTAYAIYASLLVHANLFADLDVTVYGAVVQAYVVTGLLTSLGSKAVHDRFGHLIAKAPVVPTTIIRNEVDVDKLEKAIRKSVGKLSK